MPGLPPPPIQDQPGSFGWMEWYRQLRDYISSASSVPWNVINFTGSKISDIALRSHNDLQNLQGGTPGSRYHLTETQHAAVLESITSSAGSSITITNNLTTTDSNGFIVADTTSNNITVTLHTASGNKEIQVVKGSSPNVLTIAGTFNGFSSITVYLKDTSLRFKYVSGTWYII